MQRLIITGKKTLNGKIIISGSKNASLPILAATILSDKKIILRNVPLVKDVFTMVELLNFIGSKIIINKLKKQIIIFPKKKLKSFTAPYRLLKTMRAGILVLGPLLSRFKKAKVSLPGGCAIGARPVDLHISVLRQLGANIKIKNGYIIASALKGLKGGQINIPKISVGATESAILSSVFANKDTTIKNCAVEPEIINLINFLKSLGVHIEVKKRTIKVYKTKESLKETNFEIMFDRIEAGTYMIAGALTAKKLIVDKINPKIIQKEINILKKMGVKIKTEKSKITIFASNNIKKINVKTSPYPGFPTDLQAQIMVLMLKAKGQSSIQENIFENRFMHVQELNRMGASIQIKKNKAYLNGGFELSGAEVMATDLRASVSLVLAGLIAKNQTTINRVYHLDRGYENLEKKLNNCNAKIVRKNA